MKKSGTPFPRSIFPVTLLAGATVTVLASAALGQTGYRFDFGPGPAKSGYAQVTASTTFNGTRGYGFDFNVPVTCVDRGGTDSLTRDVCHGSRPFYFSMNLAEGNYDVSVTLGDGAQAADATVKAESRRLFVEKAETAAGAFATRTFTVNRRNAAIAGGSASVGLTTREQGGLNWDGNKLTLEFNGGHAAVAAMEIAPASAARQVFLAGNSTQCDWATESETAWGQMFPRFFRQGAVVVSLAEAGLTGTAFIAQRRLDKITGMMKPGDYLMAEFAHNDMGVLDIAGFKENFVTFITRAKAKGGIPVLVTPTPRRTFSGAKASNSFVNANGDYVAAIKQVAQENDVLLIDLNACGTAFIEALGPSVSAMAYWYNPASGQDNTHWNRYGAYELAKCMAQGVQDGIPALAPLLAEDFAGFDPGAPDPVDTLRIPASADTSVWHRTVGLAPADRPSVGTGMLSIDPEARRIGYASAEAGLADFSVHALDGSRLAAKVITVRSGEKGGLVWAELANLPHGLYFLRMRMQGRTRGTVRFLKR